MRTFFTDVNQVINVIEIASKRVREREIKTENVTLEVSVQIVGLIELRMQTDVANTEVIEEKMLDVNHNFRH
ncbi:hypothetical protein [Halotia branconii]|uniref:Uncharacterized protein n=1 Tax=Halotia branconii CENA392 TaxID=1539056 RepID=A0AAJ6NSC7_9CYAN|nr:hypothetical protein [Halotia branconii]WGV25518.1 hypothetical protein QI031_27940 [Halotia branconii CENA392]